MTKLQELLNSIKSLEDCIDSYAIDFAREWYNSDISYIEDAFHEFADQNTSIYYEEQRQYYYEHDVECEEAMIEYGYDFNDLVKEIGLNGLIAKAGAIGQYKAIYDELSYYEEEIELLMDLYRQYDAIVKKGGDN